MARMPTRKAAGVADVWRNRIVAYGEMTAEELQANPNNPRLHGPSQKSAMSTMLGEVGWVVPIVVNRTSGLIVDGHMRVDLAPGRGPIPVAFVELTEPEERELLALMDPIGQMATYNPDVLATVLEGLSTAISTADVLEGLIPEQQADDTVAAMTVQLKPLQRAHVLISVPLDRWDEVAELLDAVGAVAGVALASTVK